jgi:hypothetical protein
MYHYGNPFPLSGWSRKESIDNFRKWIKKEAFSGLEPERRKWILENMHRLKDKRLGCFCKQPDSFVACHGDIYVEILDA